MIARLGLVALVGASCGDGIDRPPLPVPVDSNVGLVRVRHVPEGPASSVPVYFQNRDSSVVLATRTDAAGNANAFMPPDGFVTIAAPAGSTWFLYTYAGVQPGDELVFQLAPARPTSHEFTLRFPPLEGAFSYALDTECGRFDVTGAERSPLPMVLRGCDRTTDMLVTTVASSTARYLFANHVDLESGTITLPGPYQYGLSRDVTINDVPADSPDLILEHALATPLRDLVSQGGEIVTPFGGVGWSIVFGPYPPDGTIRTTVVAIDNSMEGLTDWRPSTEPAMISYGARRLRMSTTRPRFDASIHALVWDEASTGTPGNLVRASFQWFTSAGQTFVWQIVSPRGELPVIPLPVLPDPALRIEGSVIGPQTVSSILVDGPVERARTQLIGRWQPGRRWPFESESGQVRHRDMVVGVDER